MTPPRPPRLASRLLGLALQGEDGSAFHGDLDERFRKWAERHGEGSARVWYWKQTLSVLLWTGADRMEAAAARVTRPGRPQGRHTRGESGGTMDGLLGRGRQIGLAFRTLANAPTFTGPAVLLVGLGVGGFTTVFTLVDHVLLRPLPYPESERLVRIGRPGETHSGPVILAMAELGAFDGWAIGHSEPATLLGQGEPLQVEQAAVSRGFFTLLGGQPSLGRLLVEDDFAGADAVVISEGTWRRVFGGDPDVVGHSVRLDGETLTVGGVLSADFAPPQALVAADVDVWRPIDWSLAPNLRPDYSVLGVAARLAHGVSPAAAQAELNALAEHLAERYPENLRRPDGTPEPLVVVGLHEATVQRARTGLGLLLGGVTLLLVIACLDIAHLFLARGLSRTREMAVRRALGARSAGLAWQLLVESLMVGLMGGALGVVLAWIGLDALLALRPETLPLATEARLDPRVLAFAAAVSVGTAVLFGLLPALRSIGGDLARGLSGSSRGASSGRTVTGFHRGIVVAEVALSLMLIALTGLLIGRYRQLQSVDPGFDPDDLWTIPLTLTAASSPLEYHQAMDAVAASLAGVPGVASATYGLLMPFEITGGGDCCWNNRGMVAGGRTHEDVRVLMQPVHADYFHTLGIPLLHGAGWHGSEPGQTPVPVVLSERLALDFFGSAERAVGERVAWGRRMEMIVTGVATGTRDYGLDQPATRYMYLPSWTGGYGFGRAHLAVRLHGDPPVGLARSLHEAVWAAMPGVPVPTVRSMVEWMRRSTAGRQFNSIVFGAFGVVSLVLAAAGLYGTLLYQVRQRRRELGIRLALGAAPSRIEAETLLSGVKLALLGCALGLVGTWVAGGVLARWIPDLGGGDPLTLSAAAAVLLGTAALASWLPARGAGRTDVRATLGAE